MFKNTNPQGTNTQAKEIGRSLSVAIAAVLFGSTMILSAVGPARANEAPVAGSHPCSPEAVRYLA
jgi:hypothetical protein